MKDFKVRASKCSEIMGKRALGKTGETHCKKWLKSIDFKREKSFSNKYTQKGLIVEDHAIDLVAEQLNYGFLVKNEKFYEDDYMQGTPDVVLNDHLIDVKSSWDWQTFPSYDVIVNDVYYWQGQVYMNLTGKDQYKLIYCLMDTPEHLIRREAYYYAINNGWEEPTEEIYEDFFRKMTYSDLPDEMKIKVFEFDRRQEDIEKIKERVIECRNFIKLLIPQK